MSQYPSDQQQDHLVKQQQQPPDSFIKGEIMEEAGQSQYPSDQQQDHLVKEQQPPPDSSIEGEEIMEEAGPSQHPSDQQQDHLVKEQQPPPDSLIKGTEIIEEAKAESPDPDWVINIREKLKQARQGDQADARERRPFSRVPKSLRDRNHDDAYSPRGVGLGPIHNWYRYRSLEDYKERALCHILQRTKQDIKLYLDSIKQLEERAAACYEEPICRGDEFIKIMVVDGCFMLEILRGATEGFSQLGYSPNDPVFAFGKLMTTIKRDMLLLENQLPLFVLDRLYGIQCGQPEQRGMVAKLAIRLFDPLNPTDFDPYSNLDALHILQVLRECQLPARPKPGRHLWINQWFQASGVPDNSDKRRQQLIQCVTELSNFGITFKKRNTNQFLDVKFSNGVLEIPRLLINDGTKTLFLNLVAFERYHLDSSNEIGSYLFFMVNLIKSPADVEHLRNSGIIEHWLVSDGDVAKLFKELREEGVFDIEDSYLSGLTEKVNLYCKHRRNIWWASLRNKYFNNPWTSISVLAAAVLLLLTFIQTFYGVYGYYRPR